MRWCVLTLKIIIFARAVPKFFEILLDLPNQNLFQGGRKYQHRGIQNRVQCVGQDLQDRLRPSPGRQKRRLRCQGHPREEKFQLCYYLRPGFRPSTLLYRRRPVTNEPCASFENFLWSHTWLMFLIFLIWLFAFFVHKLPENFNNRNTSISASHVF